MPINQNTLTVILYYEDGGLGRRFLTACMTSFAATRAYALNQRAAGLWLFPVFQLRRNRQVRRGSGLKKGNPGWMVTLAIPIAATETIDFMDP